MALLILKRLSIAVSNMRIFRFLARSEDGVRCQLSPTGIKKAGTYVLATPLLDTDKIIIESGV